MLDQEVTYGALLRKRNWKILGATNPKMMVMKFYALIKVHKFYFIITQLLHVSTSFEGDLPMLSYLTDAYQNFLGFIVKKPKKLSTSGKKTVREDTL